MRISIYPILRIDITDFYKYFRHFTQIFSQLDKLKKRVVYEKYFFHFLELGKILGFI